MRSAVLILLSLPLCAQNASFSGTVINSITKDPMAGVHVTVMSVPKFPDPNQPYGTTSGPDGRFTIPNLPPGVYTLSPRGNGFLWLQEKNKDFSELRITLNPGDAVTDRIIEMTPEAVISGRVVNEYGDPVEGAFVQTATRSDAIVSARTDERGQFRITCAPGRFRIAASGGGDVSVNEVRTDGSEIPVYAETWYPASDSQDHGAVVEAIAGRETSGIDIRLVRKRSFTISGLVTGTPEGPVRAEVFVHTSTRGWPSNKVDGNDRFSLSGLPAGLYNVRAHYQLGSLELNSAPVDVSLESANETGLNLKLSLGEELSGTLKFEGGAATQTPTVRLDPLLSVNWVDIKGGEVDREGKFTLTSVFPGKYRVHVDSLPENAYIKTVTLDDTPAAADVIDLSRGVNGSNIKITISLNAASIEGIASSDDGKQSCCAMVDLADSIENINDHMTSVAAGRKYRFTGLRPGKYRLIVAGPSRTYGTRTAEELFPQAPEIELHEGDHVTRDVTFKPRAPQ